MDYIASDIHLGAVPRETERAFERFLEHVGVHGSALLLGGDLFDFWFEYGEVIPGRHFRVLAAIAALVDAGIRVTLIGGNHDAWGGRFLRDEVGVDFRADPFEMVLGGRLALVAHGDGLGEGDWKYRALKTVIRSRPAIAAFRALHPQLGLRLARSVSSTEARAGEDPAASSRPALLEAWATARLRERPDLGLVVCGHAHLPAIRPHGERQFYVNSGDWVRHHSYVTVAADADPVVHRWDQAARP